MQPAADISFGVNDGWKVRFLRGTAVEDIVHSFQQRKLPHLREDRYRALKSITDC
jgi:hypothetical protein